jgi:hypothetical protein
MASYSLKKFKGEPVWLVSENRNLHDNSWAMWTYVDDVRVKDTEPLLGPYRVYSPMTMGGHASCDPVVGGLGVESAVHLAFP